MQLVSPEHTTDMLLVYMKTRIGENIRKARMTKNYTQEYLGKELGIGKLAFGKIERGETSPTVDRLEEIAKVLDTTPEALLAGDESINITAPVSNANVGNVNGSNNNHFGISEEALNSLTAALNRMCALLESRQKD